MLTYKEKVLGQEREDTGAVTASFSVWGRVHKSSV